MLLIWLLLPAASALMDCKTACDICHNLASNDTALISCSLCQECHWTLKRRMMELHLPNKQNLVVEGQVKFPNKDRMLLQGQVNNQQKELKDLEKKAFKQILQEYGWQPEDLVQAEKRVVHVSDDDCLPPTRDCLHETDENVDKDKNDNNTNKGLIKLLSNKKCPIVPQTACPSPSPTRRTCPPIIPCEKKDKLSWHGVDTSSTMPPHKRRKLILRQLARLEADYTDDMGCPTQPICSDEESEYLEPLFNKHPIRPPPLSSSTTCPDKPCKDTTTSQGPIACAPCMPSCPLPCAFPPPFLPPFPTQFSTPLPLPFLLPPPFSLSIPQEETLMTIQTTTAKTRSMKEVSHTAKTMEEDLYDDEQEVLALKGEITNTKKDYVYLYVGIPKDVKKSQRG